MKSGSIAVLFLLVSGHASIAFAQQISDSTLYETALSNTISVYKKQLGDQSPLNNGSLYAGYGFNFLPGNSPFFLTEKYNPGSVVYDGIRFDSLSLMYDDVQQLLIVRDENYLLQLINERVSSFVIAGHPFLRLVADSLNRGITRTGYYEVLYPGRSEVLKEKFRVIQERASIYEGVTRSIDDTYTYFIRKNGKYLRLKTKGEMLDIFSDHKKDIQRFMKKNKLNFRRDKDNTLAQAAGYYDQMAR